MSIKKAAARDCNCKKEQRNSKLEKKTSDSGFCNPYLAENHYDGCFTLSRDVFVF